MAEQLVLSYHKESFPILNGFAIHLFFTHDKNFCTTSTRLHDIMTENGISCTPRSVDLKLRRVIKDFKAKRERKRDFSKVEKLLAEEFSPPGIGRKRPDPAPAPNPAPAAAVMVRDDCDKCPDLRKENHLLDRNWRQKFSTLKKEKKAISKTFNKSKMNFKLSRMKVSIGKYKTEIAQLRKDKLMLERRLAALETAQNQDMFMKYLQKEKQKRRDADIALRKARTMIQDLKCQLEKEHVIVEELEEQLDKEQCAKGEHDKRPEQEDNTVKTKAYSMDMRLVIYKCILCNVPVEKAGQLVSFISDILGGQLPKSTPGPSTVSQMAYELGVLSDIQTAEALRQSECTTLAWDATSIDGVHVNEVHITSDKGTLYLQVGHLPGGKREDYLHHITSTLKSIAETYAGFQSLDVSKVLEEIYAGITCTLTDRAAVNHCVVEELSVLLHKELIELNCNVHPLDGLATSTRKALLQRDKLIDTRSSVFGSDCRIANFICALSKLRYKAGTGDPCGFKTFLDTTGLAKCVIPRYVGNRLHILFHTAGVIFHLKSHLITYLQKYCTSAQLRLALLGDFNNEEIVIQLRVLGLFGKHVTGPWMTLFYKNSDNLKHLQMGPYLRSCLTRLQELTDNPRHIVDMDRDIFGRQLTSDDVLQSLQKDDCSQVLSDVVSCVSSAMLATLRRQLDRYLDGPLSQPTPELLEQTASAPLNNISGERILGSFDALFRKAPNATVGFIDGKVKALMNGTLSYIMGKDSNTQDKLIKYATSRAAVIRSQQRQLKKRNMRITYQRQVNIAQQRDKSARKKVEKEIKESIKEGTSDTILCKLDHDFTRDFVSSLLKSEIPDEPEFLHVWDVNGDDVTFYGKVEGFKVIRKSCNVIVFYRGSGTSILPLSEFITDIMTGDLLPRKDRESYSL